ncbi:DEAD/DEAH box helicase [Methanotrichaceae archaeon M04Ac]|uniref:DEAD/DEAH box helicase n=1 Tax=Candidatus Methanocrinis alkalitolerans TaxID=3033395 RepID=A0ABT5XGS0_9EURY|nr:DEAD/DEAH box helicase [Candidatus Methanocrinis alkalitolerans]MCR3884232.1 DEAD/DEAH box helicase [Methanothrix sp.]MDF0593826.1 DEAD/DEAH box helicase [Candidatus Methanocrinis alkalitolerans]
MTSYLQHPMLKEKAVERRLFQLELASTALKASTLVVLPTGLGKTVVALMVLLARLPRGKALFLAPTKPLVEQHASFLEKVLEDASIAVTFTGEIPPDRRREMWEGARVVVSTPQVVENDLLSRRISLRGVSLIIFDEAHRAVGNYAYVYIAERYQREGTDRLVLGITASPGSSLERIEEVSNNLGAMRIETKTEADPDVSPFVHEREIEVVKVAVPSEIMRLRTLLEEVLEDRGEALHQLGGSDGLRMPKRMDRTSKKELLEMQKTLRGMIAKNPSPSLYQAVSVLAEVLKLKHAVELAETQGVDSLARYLDRLESEASSPGGSKAAKRIMADPRVVEAVSDLARMDVDHPKLRAVRELVEEQLTSKPESRIMVFTNYRDTASSVLDYLREGAGELIRPVRFVGQSSRAADEGLSQKKQAEILRKFRDGEYNVLIATSVGEEGIDIPATDLVLFYEPVPSEIRSIQRKGRTGRARAGRVVVLVARGTRDEAYRWISDRKEKNMRQQIREMSWPDRRDPGSAAGGGAALPPGGRGRQLSIGEVGGGAAAAGGQPAFLDRPEEEEASALVAVDPRERSLARMLESMGVGVTLRFLEVGDYIVSDRVGIERKTADDFVDSLIGGERNLFAQLKDLSRNYERPILILEGRDLYARQVHPNAIRGALASIAVDFGVAIIPTADEDETVSVIAAIARREQQAGGGSPHAHGKKTHRTLKEQQEYLVSSIPGVGNAVAKNLLRSFGSVERVFAAPAEELEAVPLVGPKTAERIRELVGGEYKG